MYDQYRNSRRENVYESANFDGNIATDFKSFKNLLNITVLDSVKELRFIFVEDENGPKNDQFLAAEQKIDLHLSGFDGYMITIIFLLIIFIFVILREFRKSRSSAQLEKPEFVIG